MTQPAERATIVIAVLVAAVSLHLASEFLIPVTLALVLSALLWPVVQRLARWHVPSTAGATICILTIVVLLIGAGAALGPPIRDFADDIPESINAARPKIASMSAKLGRLTGTQSAAPKSGDTTGNGNTTKMDSTQRDSTRATNDSARSTDSVQKSNSQAQAQLQGTASGRAAGTTAGTTSGTAAGTTSGRKQGSSGTAASPVSGLPSSAPAAITHALGVASSLLGDFVEVMLLALFILAAGTAWKHKLDESVDAPSTRKKTVEVVSEMQGVVSRYVLVTALINIAQAVVVGVALKLLGYSSPLLWGILTFALEFVPYLGGMVMLALLTVAGLAAGRGFPAVLAGPAVYMAVTTLQNNVLSPVVYGNRMKLNPVAILLALMLWYMLWGVAGAFLSVPILAAFNVYASRTPSLKTLSVFLSD